jgi:glycosyltransferase involved in cell wall biosynthesis
MIEALVCKSIPLLCNDNPTASELAPLEYICEPKASDIANRIRYLDKDYAKYVEENFKWYGENYLKQFSKEAVAQNILNVYASLKTV